MKFKVTGRYGGRVRTVEWEDGELSGDELLVAVITSRARAHEKSGIGYGLAGGPRATMGILEEHQIAAAFIAEAFDEVIEHTWENPAPSEDDGQSVQ